MVNFDNIAATAPDRCSDCRQHSRLIGNVDPQPRDPTIGRHVAVENRGKQARVDVAAADHGANGFAGKQLWMLIDGGNTGSASTFGDDTLLFDKCANRPFQRLFMHQQNVINQIADNGFGHATGLFHGNALGQGFAAADDLLVGNGHFHCRIEFGLHAIDFQIGPHVAGNRGDATNQPATTNRHQQNIEVRPIGEHLEASRSLTGHHQFIVIGVNQCQPALFNQCGDGSFTFVQIAALKNHLSTKAARAGHLGKGRLRRHHDDCWNIHLLGMIGNSLRVIASRHGDHAALSLSAVKRHHRDIGTARLEGRGVLQTFELENQIAAKGAGQHRGIDKGGAQDIPLKARGGIADIIGGNGH